MEPTVFPAGKQDFIVEPLLSVSMAAPRLVFISWVTEHSTVPFYRNSQRWLRSSTWSLIDHYTTDSFIVTTSQYTPMIRSALQRSRVVRPLLGSFQRSPLFVGNFIDVLFRFFDQFDLRSVHVPGALLFRCIVHGLVRAVPPVTSGLRFTPISPSSLSVDLVPSREPSRTHFRLSRCHSTDGALLRAGAVSPSRCRDSSRALWGAVCRDGSSPASLSTVQGFLSGPSVRSAWSRGPPSSREPSARQLVVRRHDCHHRHIPARIPRFQ